MIRLSDEIQDVLQHLEHQGYQAYIVGGFVRDALEGQLSTDLDIATDARPEQLYPLFKTIETNVKMNQYGIKFERGAYNFEITTMRRETYNDTTRHPDAFEFVTTPLDDAIRRDFTVNALYYNRSNGILDFHGGMADLASRRIRMIGDPIVRFREDPIRILRLFRFQGEHQYQVDAATFNAAFMNRDHLMSVQGVNLRHEITRLLLSVGCYPTMIANPWVLGKVFAPLEATIHFDQKNPYHNRDLFNHTLTVVAGTPRKLEIRYAALFHDIGKVNTQTIDNQGIAHYRGHAIESKHLAEPILESLQLPKKQINYILDLITYHSMHLEISLSQMQQLIRVHGLAWTQDLIRLKHADNLAKSDKAAYQLEKTAQFEQLIQTIQEENYPTHVRDLALSPLEIQALGVALSQTQIVLERLLDGVINQTITNTKEALTAYIMEELQ
ncbi:CCA tRNA nucleotidyltransferase [Erysipelothrix anatis]|uniref:CCA tRNA nucleotidyltransferase n=1 Tax=Erysipelothrix anatis TaxID=2683713 RepID=UPI001357B0D7|nr:HD domain-containing protein [Erysipelothrix anatis]